MGKWINIEDEKPENLSEVTIYQCHGQISQATFDESYCGNFKQKNYSGWECVSLNEQHIKYWMDFKIDKPDATCF